VESENYGTLGILLIFPVLGPDILLTTPVITLSIWVILPLGWEKELRDAYKHEAELVLYTF
jgi:hypothetical protein